MRLLSSLRQFSVNLPINANLRIFFRFTIRDTNDEACRSYEQRGKNDWSPKGSLSLIIPRRAGPFLCQAPERMAIHRFPTDPALLQARPLLRTMRPVVGTNKEKKMIGHRKVRCRSSFPAELGPSYMTGLDYQSPRVLPAASLFFNDIFSFFRSRIISFFESMSSLRSETMSFCSSS